MNKVLYDMSELKIAETLSPPPPPHDTDNSPAVIVVSEIHSEPEDMGGSQEASSSSSSTKRSLRKRANSEDHLHSIKNKSIKKRKNSASCIEFKTEKEVRKYYLNINKNIKVQPILLETIFEQLDESIEDNDDDDDNVKEFGRATRRTLNIRDGFSSNKSLIKKRKNMIKKNLGKRKKPKKMALARFKEEFKKKMLDLSD